MLCGVQFHEEFFSTTKCAYDNMQTFWVFGNVLKSFFNSLFNCMMEMCVSNMCCEGLETSSFQRYNFLIQRLVSNWSNAPNALILNFKFNGWSTCIVKSKPYKWLILVEGEIEIDMEKWLVNISLKCNSHKNATFSTNWPFC
jgi:hypothetical protein